MVWDIVWFVVTVAGTTAVCWWFWKSSAAERQSLKDRIRYLEDKVRGM